MSNVSQRDKEHIFEALRKGLVPERGIAASKLLVDVPGGAEAPVSRAAGRAATRRR